jgi:hypothetical protein
MAKALKASVRVLQIFNSRYIPLKDQRSLYKVKSATNTVAVSIGEELSKDQVENLIQCGTSVAIV